MGEANPMKVKIPEREIMTLPERDRMELSSNEMVALYLLHSDGWTYNELKMVFEVGDESVKRALNYGRGVGSYIEGL